MHVGIKRLDHDTSLRAVNVYEDIKLSILEKYLNKYNSFEIEYKSYQNAHMRRCCVHKRKTW